MSTALPPEVRVNMSLGTAKSNDIIYSSTFKIFQRTWSKRRKKRRRHPKQTRHQHPQELHQALGWHCLWSYQTCSNIEFPQAKKKRRKSKGVKPEVTKMDTSVKQAQAIGKSKANRAALTNKVCLGKFNLVLFLCDLFFSCVAWIQLARQRSKKSRSPSRNKPMLSKYFSNSKILFSRTDTFSLQETKAERCCKIVETQSCFRIENIIQYCRAGQDHW